MRKESNRRVILIVAPLL